MIRILIKYLRRQPKAIRDNIALGMAGVFTAVVAVFLFYTAPNGFFASVEGGKVTDEESSSVFSHFFSDIGSQFSSVKEAVTETTKTFDEIRKASEEHGNASTTSSGDEINYFSTSSAFEEKVAIYSSSTVNDVGASSSEADVSSSTYGKPRAIRVIAASTSTATTSVE